MNAQEPTYPAYSLINITPSDSLTLASVCRQLYVGVGGDVSVVTESGVTSVFKNVGSGQNLGPFFISKVLATNTSATNIIGFV